MLMKKNKIPLCILLLLFPALLIGCSAKPPASRLKKSSAAETRTSIVNLKFPVITGGMVPKNLTNVQNTLNTYLEERAGIHILFDPVEISSLEDYYLVQKSRTDSPDFITLLPAESLLSKMVQNDLVLPLDDLIAEYGKDLPETAGEVLPMGQLNNIQYMIPQVKSSYAIGTGIEFNKELVKKYQIDIQSIKTLDDLEPYLAMLQKEEPDVIPLAGTPGSTGFTSLLSKYDNLTDTLGVLDLSQSENLTVVNWYETEEFMTLAKRMRRWYQKGYIYKDALLLQKTSTELASEGKAFCLISTYMPRADEGTSVEGDGALVEAQLEEMPQILTSYQVGLEGICISSNCQHPEKAMEFINLLYTDPYIVNLIEYGIEDEDYTITKDQLIDRGNIPFLIYGQPLNQKLRSNTVEDGMDYAEKCVQYDQNTISSPALGFVFDETPVSQEVALCQAVVDYYYAAIDCGCVDPETEIPVFIKSLKSAGIDKIIAEKQRQLNEWEAEQ